MASRLNGVQKHTIKNLTNLFGFNPFEKNEWVKITNNQKLEELIPQKYAGVLGYITPIDKDEIFNRVLGLKKDKKKLDEVYKKLIHPVELNVADDSRYILFVSEKSKKKLGLTQNELMAVMCQQLYYLYDGVFPKRRKVMKWFNSNIRYFGINILLAIIIGCLSYPMFLSMGIPLIIAMGLTSFMVFLGIQIHETITKAMYIMKLINFEKNSDMFTTSVMGTPKHLISMYEKLSENNVSPGSFAGTKIPRLSWEKRINMLKKLDI